MTLVEEATRFILETLAEPAGPAGPAGHGTNAGAASAPLVVFVSGPQGSGKTYSTRAIHAGLERARPQLRCASVSIDDFYLTHAAQHALGARYPDNALLQGRGLPGTHDMPLLRAFVASLGTAAGTLQVPQYDKAQFCGEGDRVAPRSVRLPLDVVLIEGWFLGFEAVGAHALARMYAEETPRGQALRRHGLQQLVQIDAALPAYAQLLWDNPAVSSVGVVLAADVANVYRWRAQQEQQLVAQHGSGMSEEQVRSFVARYMPCYEVYYRTLARDGLLGNRGTLVVELDEERRVRSSLRRGDVGGVLKDLSEKGC
ncbi:LAFE_0A07558g1_1 [Lachancea fermentati]|uniref:LAFE_0A07558g1_1 n=1 Tax=Lachancea fermentati TaxID=4955 RepID=A0A1G4M718_LACFM|nr:LAFE_0A07558g1_1 [Lachancea fermentati]